MAVKTVATPTLHYEQTAYQGIERVSKEKCLSIDGQCSPGEK
jgi:hypothetical protein